MGQACSKDTVKKLEDDSSAITNNQLEVGASNGDSEVESNSRQAHAALEELLDRLSSNEVEAFLKSFRVKSQLERSVLHEVNEQSSWKKLSITAATLRETLGLIHRTTLRKLLCSYVHQYFHSCTTSLNSHIEIVSSQQIFRSFKVSEFLFGRRGSSLFAASSTDNGSFVGFQEYCATLSICLHGVKEEMLALLFLLFAESAAKDNSESSLFSVYNEKSDELENVRPITSASSGVTLPAKDSKSSISGKTSSKKKVFLTAKVTSRSVDHGLFSFIGSRFVGSSHMTSLIITELGIYKLLLFFVLYYDCSHLVDGSFHSESTGSLWSQLDAEEQIQFFNSVNWLISNINRLASESSPAVAFSYDSFMLLFTDRTAFVESIFDPARSFFGTFSRLSSSVDVLSPSPTHASNSVPATSSGSFTFLDRKDSKEAPSSSSSNFSTISELPALVRKVYFEYGKEQPSSVLHTYAYGAIHNYMNTLKAVHEFFECEKQRYERKQFEKRHSEELHKVDEDKNGNSYPREDLLSAKALDDENIGFYEFVNQVNNQAHDVPYYPAFVIEASWFEWWCMYMEVRPVYLDRPNSRSLLVDIEPIAPKAAEGPPSQMRPPVWKISHRFPAKDFAYTNRNGLQPYRDNLLVLKNQNLLQKNFSFKGLHRFLDSNELKEWNDPSQSSAKYFYVLLPYRLGATLYREFDTDSVQIAPETYKRYLVFNDGIQRQPATSEKQSPNHNLNGDREALDRAEDIISKLKAVPTISVDLFPTQIPIFSCTRVGISAIAHFDTVIIDKLRDELLSQTSDASPQPSPYQCFPSPFSWRSKLTQATKNFTQAYLSALKINIDTKDETTENGITAPSSSFALHYSDIRWWGLCENDSFEGVTVAHSAQYHWRLLTVAAEDYNIPFIDLISNSSGGQKNSSASVDNYFLALMMESKNTRLYWPTSRLRSWCFDKQNIHLQQQEKIIGQMVDVLTDFNVWSFGRVTAVVRDNASTAHNVLITVKLTDPIYATLSTESHRSDILSVPFGSGRIVPYGFMTNLCAGIQSSSLQSDYSPVVAKKQAQSGVAPTPLPQNDSPVNAGGKILRSRKVSELPPLLISLDLEAAFIRSVKTLRGEEIGRAILGHYSTSLTKIRERRAFQAHKQREKREKVAALKAEIEAELLAAASAKNNAEYASNDRIDGSDVESGISNSVEADNDEEDEGDIGEAAAEGAVGSSVSFGSANRNSLKLLLRNNSSKVIPITDSEEAANEIQNKISRILDEDEIYSAASDEKESSEHHKFLFVPTAEITAEKSLLVSTLLADSESSLYSIRWPISTRLLYSITRTDDILNNNDSRNIVCVVPNSSISLTPSKPTSDIVDSRKQDAGGLQKSVTTNGLPFNGNGVIQANETMTSSTIDTYVSENKGDEGRSSRKSRKLKEICSKYIFSISSQVRSLIKSEKKRNNEADKANLSYSNYNTRVTNSMYRNDGLENSNLKKMNGNELFNRGKVHLNIGVVGLNNMGNTCYLSSAIQCLIRTPLFVPYFLTDQYLTDLALAVPSGKPTRLSTAFAYVLQRIFSTETLSIDEGMFLNLAAESPSTTGTIETTRRGKHDRNYFQSMNSTITKYDSISLTKFLRVFQYLKPYFHGNNQHDAQEFLSELLDSFHEDLKKSVPKRIKDRNNTSQKSEQGISEKAEKDKLSNQSIAPPTTPNLTSSPPSSEDIGVDNSRNTTSGRIQNEQQAAKDVNKDGVSSVAAVPDKVESGAQKKRQKDSSRSSLQPPPQRVDDLSAEEIIKRGDEQWEIYLQKNSSIISHIFTGQLCSKVICKQCNFTSVRFEAFNTLSLPLPKYFNSSQGVAASTFSPEGSTKRQINAIVTIIRKMPRHSHVSQLRKNYRSKYFETKYLTEINRLLAHPIRLTISVSSSMAIYDLKIKATIAYNAILAKVYQSVKDDSTLTGDLGDLSKLISALGLQLPELVFHNTVVSEDGADAGIRKILDNTEPISSLVDDGVSSFRVVMQENSKDMSFLGKLKGSDLTYSPTKSKNSKPNDALYYIYSYVDAQEYDAQNLLDADWKPKEGRFFADFDYKFSNSCIAPSHNAVPASATKGKKIRKSAEKVDINATESDGTDGTIIAPLSSPPAMFSRQFPTKLKDFVIGDRVDAVDQKCMWYSGTVVDVYNIALADIRKYAYKKYPRKPLQPSSPYGASKSGKRSNSVGSNNTSSTGKPVFVTSGPHVRIHFDNFSPIWDEWYDQQDFDDGCILPIYSKSARKIKVLNFQVIQRIVAPFITDEDDFSDDGQTDDGDDDPTKLTLSSASSTALSSRLTTNKKQKNFIADKTVGMPRENYQEADGQTEESSGANLPEGSKKSSKGEFRIEVLDCPLLVQCESYRSTQHLYNLIAEQITRHYTAAELQECFESNNWDTDPKPFTLRILSNNNLFAQPADMEKFWTDGVERFYGHKNWEGSEYPANYFAASSFAAGYVRSSELPDLLGDDFCGPVIGIYHNRLILTVDWHLNKRQSSYEELWRQRDLRILNDSTYEKYLAWLATEQQRKLESEAAASAAASNASSVPTETAENGSEKSDKRHGMDLEYVLKKFVESEDIDEYVCDNCKTAVPATLRTTIFRLPDVLVLHLKRLVINGTGGGKIRTLVKFPIENLDVSPFLNGDLSVSNASYNLYGVVNHLGGMHGGHYTAFAKCESIVVSSSGLSGGQGASAAAAVGLAGEEGEGDYLSSISLANLAGSKIAVASHLLLKNKTPDLSEHLTLSKSETLHSKADYKWLKFDDEFVLEMPVQTNPYSLVTDGAYLLFYERKHFSPQNILKYI